MNTNIINELLIFAANFNNILKQRPDDYLSSLNLADSYMLRINSGEVEICWVINLLDVSKSLSIIFLF